MYFNKSPCARLLPVRVNLGDITGLAQAIVVLKAFTASSDNAYHDALLPPGQHFQV
jgi:hypothetical protein